jgi:signal transduction histidine kinase
VAKSNVYLIFKEALNNAAKHADATEVHASLTHAGNQLRLTVKDNGQGLPAGGSDPAGSGNGLRNMMTRAEDVEGKLEVRSEAGGGTCIELTLRA